jgi:hypothetical protein
VTFAEYRDNIYDRYRWLQQMFHSDEDGYNEICQVVIDFCNNQSVDHSEFDGSTKAVVAHMQSAKDQFTNLVGVDPFVLLTCLTNILISRPSHGGTCTVLPSSALSSIWGQMQVEDKHQRCSLEPRW